MSDASFSSLTDPRITTLAEEFSRLSSDDQYLVLALVSRLAGQEPAGFAPDVPFMDFEE